MAKHGFTSPSNPKNLSAPATTRNAAGGEAFTIDNPSIRLIAQIGKFFNEPSYYTANAQDAIVIDGEKLQFNDAGLQVDAKNLIKTAMEVANSNNAKDLLHIANWARNHLNMRTTPQILLAVAAYSPALKSTGWVREYCRKVVQRPDDAKQVFASWVALFGANPNAKNRKKGDLTPNQKLPAALKRGLADYIAHTPVDKLLKYNTPDHPTLADMLKMLDRSKDYPLPAPVAKYLVEGTVSDGLPEELLARVNLSKMSVFTEEAKELAKKANVTWEFLKSQFSGPGTTQKQNAAIWEFVIPRMGYMALLRNIRNFEQADITKAAWAKVRTKLTTPEAVAASKQMPFRFLSALEAVSTVQGKDIVDTAFSECASQTTGIEGDTAIFIDVSGSMDAVVSKDSTMTLRGAAAAMATVLAKKLGLGAHIIIFGDHGARISFTSQTAASDILQKIMNANKGWHSDGTNEYVGHGTNTTAAMEILGSQKVDRIIIVSDMQMYRMGGTQHVYGVGMNTLAEKYRREINPDAWIYAVNMQGHGDSQVDPNDPRNIQMTGYSEKIFEHISVIETPAVEVTPVHEEKTAKKETETPEALLEIVRREW